jgi:hypothetical protein
MPSKRLCLAGGDTFVCPEGVATFAVVDPLRGTGSLGTVAEARVYGKFPAFRRVEHRLATTALGWRVCALAESWPVVAPPHADVQSHTDAGGENLGVAVRPLT